MLKDDAVYGPRAQKFVAKARDITELLAELGPVPAKKPLPLRVTYQEPCHLVHGQKVISQPRRILNAIPALALVEMKDSAMCCGSAGTYNITQPEMAQRLQRDKLDNALATGATIILSANTGCMIQLEAGLTARDNRAEVRHIVEILDAAYRNDGRYEAGIRPVLSPKSRLKPAALAMALLAVSTLLLWLLARRRK